MYRILVVDDERSIRSILRSRLEHESYFVDEAEDGRDAIAKFAVSLKNDDVYDLVLLDIMMPEIDGKAVLDTIRRIEELDGTPLGKGVPVIMLTALKQGFMDLFNRGCDDYLIKPYESQELLDKIRKKIEE